MIPIRPVARWFAEKEPIVLVVVLLLLWTRRDWTGPLLLAVPILWASRWMYCGGPVRVGRADGLFAVLLGLVPLTLIPVADWSVALPKVTGLLLGVALAYAIANVATSGERLDHLAELIVLGLGSALVLAGLAAGGLSNVAKLLPVVVAGAADQGLLRRLLPGMEASGINPNEVGGAATLLLPLAAARVRFQKPSEACRLGRARQVGALSIAALLTVVIVLTQSRGAYVGALVGLIVVLAGPRVGRLLVPAIALGVLALGVAVVSGVPVPLPGGAESLGPRLALWRRALEMLRDAPYTGIGPGQFDLVLHAMYLPPGPDQPIYAPHAHSLVLQLGLDLGIPGALVFLFLVLWIVRTLHPIAWDSRAAEVRATAVGVIGGLLGFFIFGVADTIALGARGGIGLWAIIGLGMASACVAARSSLDRRATCPDRAVGP